MRWLGGGISTEEVRRWGDLRQGKWGVEGWWRRCRVGRRHGVGLDGQRSDGDDACTGCVPASMGTPAAGIFGRGESDEGISGAEGEEAMEGLAERIN